MKLVRKNTTNADRCKYCEKKLIVIDYTSKIDMKKKEKVVVYTYGVFDLFHRGHVELLRDAKKLGDELVVGVFSDEVAESFKRRPVIGLKDRKYVIQNCAFVDRVIVQKQLSPDGILKKIKPNILAKGPGAGWGDSSVAPGEIFMRKNGGKVVKLKYHKGISTSEIINKIKKS